MEAVIYIVFGIFIVFSFYYLGVARTSIKALKSLAIIIDKQEKITDKHISKNIDTNTEIALLRMAIEMVEPIDDEIDTFSPDSIFRI